MCDCDKVKPAKKSVPPRKRKPKGSKQSSGKSKKA